MDFAAMSPFIAGVIVGMFVVVGAKVIKDFWKDRESRLDVLAFSVNELLENQRQNEKEFDKCRKVAREHDKKITALVDCVNLQKYMEGMNRIDELERVNNERDQ